MDHDLGAVKIAEPSLLAADLVGDRASINQSLARSRLPGGALWRIYILLRGRKQHCWERPMGRLNEPREAVCRNGRWYRSLKMISSFVSQ
jgi:hypothetical protein